MPIAPVLTFTVHRMSSQDRQTPGPAGPPCVESRSSETCKMRRKPGVAVAPGGIRYHLEHLTAVKLKPWTIRALKEVRHQADALSFAMQQAGAEQRPIIRLKISWDLR